MANYIAGTRENEPVTGKSPQQNNLLLQVPATFKNNPLVDEVLGYMAAYRHELNQEVESLHYLTAILTLPSKN
ncbi:MULTISPECIES: hypothetical protein [unclassified Coleofasciculus]|uniref:hypothetical protein n=1 Tax=unclassified Coleofasciculus TaxID=2692782 RepID=UPI001881BDE1|nr:MULTISPECIES: hypothetical protein [unclassified Coleofasciculus]MBE9125378.1 hypothetical protein [Coleofasciculus sp. LEGE 07081]MBE9147405.1 hypothetical protein [Coleofasciculus sp. LEGE 07092]